MHTKILPPPAHTPVQARQGVASFNPLQLLQSMQACRYAPSDKAPIQFVMEASRAAIAEALDADEIDDVQDIVEYLLKELSNVLADYDKSHLPAHEALMLLKKACPFYNKLETINTGPFRDTVQMAIDACKAEAVAILPKALEQRMGLNQKDTQVPGDATINGILDYNLYVDLGISKEQQEDIIYAKVVTQKNLLLNAASFLGMHRHITNTERLTTAFKAFLRSRGKQMSSDAERMFRQRNEDKIFLRSQLHITADPFARTDPHMISGGEFEEAADIYSGIREGNSKIRFAGKDLLNRHFTSRTFRQKTMTDILKLLQTNTGRRVLSYLHTGGKDRRRITQIGDADEASDISRYCVEDGSNGIGSDSEIYYQQHDMVAPLETGDTYFSSDTRLMHEMIHAFHATQGIVKEENRSDDEHKGKVGETGPAGYNEAEEYATIGLGAFAGDNITENTYRAERRKLAPDLTEALKYQPRGSYKAIRRPFNLTS